MQLRPWTFEQAAAGKLELTSRMQVGRAGSALAAACGGAGAERRNRAHLHAAEPGGAACCLMQEGYSHSYNFIATFVDEHVAFHAKHLAA